MACMIYSSQYFSMEAQDAAKEVYEEWEQENLFSKPLMQVPKTEASN